jgi:HAD superfamily hydrolase (TIGR01509 family)
MSSGPPIQAVIFDMDGLMLDTERIALAVLSAAARSLGYPWRDEIGLAMVGLNARDSDLVVARHLGPGYSTGPLRDAFNRGYMEAIENEPLPLKPGLLELLDWLELNTIPKAVATSTRRERAQLKLRRTGLLERFSVIVGGDQVARGKPAPDIYLAAATGLQVAPECCLALEDSAPGVRAASSAGMPVIMVPDILPPSAEIAVLGRAVAGSLHDVLDWLANGASTSPLTKMGCA